MGIPDGSMLDTGRNSPTMSLSGVMSQNNSDSQPAMDSTTRASSELKI